MCFGPKPYTRFIAATNCFGTRFHLQRVRHLRWRFTFKPVSPDGRRDTNGLGWLLEAG